MEELLEKARRDYPAGTVFKSAFNPDRKGKVTHLNFFVESENIFTEQVIYNAKKGINKAIYYEGVWAKIISKPEVKEKTMTLLEQAKKRFPIGTKFEMYNTDKIATITTGLFKNSGSWVHEVDEKGLSLETDDYYHCLYYRGNWARIIEEPKVDEKQIIEKTEERIEICTKKDPVNPSHYTSSKIECIDAIESALSPEEFKGFLRGNIIKYNWRCMQKNGAEDLKKSMWYLDRLIKTLENESNNRILPSRK